MRSIGEAVELRDRAIAVDAAVLGRRTGEGLRAKLGALVELTKPRMNFLVVITTAVGYYMATRGGVVDWLNLVHALAGTALTAGGASALNQYAERQWDGLMRRTASRPLPAQRLTPAEAATFGIALAVVGVVYLAALVNPLTAILGAVTLLSYVLIYTPLKRKTTLCTLVGAVPGAIPPVMGWTAVQNAVTPEAAALFGVLFVWQMPHFLAIAILYRDDYRSAGFRMLPVVDRGLRMTGRQIVLYATCLLPLTLMPVAMGMTGPVYFVLATLLGGVFVAAALGASGGGRGESRRLFVASILYLPLLLAAMMLDKL